MTGLWSTLMVNRRFSLSNQTLRELCQLAHCSHAIPDASLLNLRWLVHDERSMPNYRLMDLGTRQD
jgi:hypothetical protein